MTRLRNPDLWLIAAALLYALPSLVYPYISDHAANWYMGYWWTQGLVPYLDTWDNKSPGIFALHALNVLLLGDGMVPIRFVDALTVVALALGIHRLVRGGGAALPGERGTIVWLVVAFYYSTLTFSDTSQAESWEAAFSLASFGLAFRASRAPLQMFLAGVCGGVAILFKTPAILICVGVGAMLFHRLWSLRAEAEPRREAGLDFSLYVLGGVSVGILTLAYFAAAGALLPMLEWAFLFAPAYTAHYAEPEAIFEVLEIYLLSFGLWFFLLVPLAGYALWSAYHPGGAEGDAEGGDSEGAAGAGAAPERELALTGLLLLGLAFGTVVMQLSWASYHWVILMPFFMLLVAQGVRQLLLVRPAAFWGINGAVLLVATLGAPEWVESDEFSYSYPDHAYAAGQYLLGKRERVDYLSAFEQPTESFADEEELSNALRAEAEPGDRLLVMGYHPLVHALSRLRSMDRFAHGAWEIEESPFFEEWTAERERIFRETPPRFIVVDEAYEEELVLIHSGNFEEWQRFENLLVFMRVDDESPGGAETLRGHAGEVAAGERS